MTPRAGTELLFRRVRPATTASTQRRSNDVFVRLLQAPIQEFEGDYIVTSTNPRLEGVHRRNWWGFAGRSGCDASLHELYQQSSSSNTWTRNYLVRESQKELRMRNSMRQMNTCKLPFGDCLVTDSGPLLPKVGRIIHTCVPRYPAEAEPAQHNVVNKDEAWNLLHVCYTNVFQTIKSDYIQRRSDNGSSFFWSTFLKSPLQQESPSKEQQQSSISVCLPAIGCGYNGYPVREAARIALDCIHEINKVGSSNDESLELQIEVRFRETQTYETWQQELKARVPSQFEYYS